MTVKVKKAKEKVESPRFEELLKKYVENITEMTSAEARELATMAGGMRAKWGREHPDMNLGIAIYQLENAVSAFVAYREAEERIAKEKKEREEREQERYPVKRSWWQRFSLASVPCPVCLKPVHPHDYKCHACGYGLTW